MTGFSIADKTILSSVSRSDVEATTIKLKQFLEAAKWVGSKNRYSRSILSRLKTDVQQNSVKGRSLAQQIAASTTLHCFDGWSYLGRALGALLNGDPHRSLHLAYYAELRAALALLATEGIGIFHNKHFVIDAPESTKKLAFGNGTHIAAWTALEFWSSQPNSGSLFAKLVRPEGIPLDDWFQPHGGTGTLAPQAQNWFIQWGMDLSLAAKDRDARNESSYQPDGIPILWAADAGTVVEFVADLWRLLEPGTGSSFDVIDRHILRISLATHFKARFGKPPSAARSKYKNFIADTISAQGLSQGSYLRDFLLLTGAKHNSSIFGFSRKRPTQAMPDVFSIISRAVLLLRVATGSVHDQLRNAAYDRVALAFWWEAIGEARGLWKRSAAPTDLQDLWKDVEDTLTQIDITSASSETAFDSFFTLSASFDPDLRALSSTERVALWSLWSA